MSNPIPPEAEALRPHVQKHLHAIKELLGPKYFLTLVCRHATIDGAYLVFSDDTGAPAEDIAGIIVRSEQENKR